MKFTHSTLWGRAMLALSFGGVFLSGGNTNAAQSKLVTDFSETSTALKWISINDSVMGGISDGEFDVSDADTLVFSGSLSLKNRGGFASIRTQPADLDISKFDTIQLRVKGDGRSYKVHLRTAKTRSASAYSAPLPTEDGVWNNISIPIKDFKFTMFGRAIPTGRRLNAEDVVSIGVMLADKQEGPFRLEMDWIRATGADDPRTDIDQNQPDIVQTAIAAGSFETLVAALKAAELVEALQAEGPFTVFAPNDEAFSKLPPETINMLLKPENRDKLVALLSYHVVPGVVRLNEQSLETLNGTPLMLSSFGGVSINEASVLSADIEASNGIIHIIDTVLIPEQKKQTPRDQIRSVIALAIERGVPLFNMGQKSACAAVYEVALESIVQGHSTALSDAEKDSLRKALSEVRNGRAHPNEQAWTLRLSLDALDASLAANCPTRR
ncbi:MAG: putative surface protein with fasciclin (FAS1) repeats [Candidatus Promineifilaceae bacterium]|jgi:uncharacterized surface protein with fasciclin (FAS1) repeats